MRSSTTLLLLFSTILVAAIAAIVVLPLGSLVVPVGAVAFAAALVALPIASARRRHRRFLRDALARAEAAPASAPEERPPAWVIARRDQHERGEVLRLEEVDGDRVRLVLPGSAAPHDPIGVGDQVHMIDDYDDGTVELWTVDTWDSDEFGDAVIQEGRLVEEFPRPDVGPDRATPTPTDGRAAGHAEGEPSWPTT